MEWFNQVDATYRADLRELNELNYQRFEAKLEQRIGELRAEMKEMRAELIKWMFIFVTGSTFTVLGVMVALLKL